MTIPDEFDDVNEAVGSEWDDETTPYERVREAISHRYTSATADNIADTARTSTEAARKHLNVLNDEGFIVTETSEDGATTYRRAPRSIVLEQASEILDNTTTDELAARVSEMQDRVSEFQAEDSEVKTTRRNLAFANAALAIDEATRVIDEDEGERRRRASEIQLKRMFRDKEYVGTPTEDVDEDELDAEIEALEAELEDELDDDE